MKGSLKAQVMHQRSIDRGDRHNRHSVSQKSFKQLKTDWKSNRSISVCQGAGPRSNLGSKKSPKNRNSRSMIGHYNIAVDRSFVASSVMMRRSPLLTSNSMMNITNNHSVNKKKKNASRDSKRNQKPQLPPP